MTDRAKWAMAKVERKSLGAQQQDAIAALLRAPRPDVAAVMAGIDEAVLRKWLEDPRFRARYREARQTFLEDAAAQLDQLAVSAVEALARNLACGVPEVEVESARVILAHAMPAMHGPMPDVAARKDGHGLGQRERR